MEPANIAGEDMRCVKYHDSIALLADFPLVNSMLNVVSNFFVSVSSVTLALLTSLLVIGCATKEQQPNAARAEKTEAQKYGTGMYSVGRSGGGLRYSGHVNIAASEEFR